MVVELHLLQNFAPSCLNRDDTNTPKDCEFGGVRRARLSSQCLKRAIRWHPEFTRMSGVSYGLRTKRLVDKLTAELGHEGCLDDSRDEIVAAVVAEAVGQLGSDQRTRVLAYLGRDEITRLRNLILEAWEVLVRAARSCASTRRDKALRDAARKVASAFTPGTRAADIALYGRMIAENTHLNIEAACQVAHALSTHRVTMEMDFFAAVDDLKPADRPGAEMIGAIEFNSACFYRYSLVSVTQLVQNLGGDQELTNEVLGGFLRASIAAIPSGKQNSMAASNPPSLILAVVRGWGMPWSLVNAFETPVRVTEHDRRGLVRQSIVALDRYFGRLSRMYGEDGIIARPACWLEDAEIEFLSEQRVATVAEVVETVQDAVGCLVGVA